MGLSPATAGLSSPSHFAHAPHRARPTTPRMPKHPRFGLLPGRSPLLGESFLFSFPAGTKMFQFPALASRRRRDNAPSGHWVVPFGDPRVNGHLRLTAAFRSLSRPSSPPRAKASAMRPSLLPSHSLPLTGGKHVSLEISLLLVLSLSQHVIDLDPMEGVSGE